MKSLLTISDAEMAAIEAQESFGVMPAIGVASSASILAFGGMAMRFSPGDAVPISGMDHPIGQLFLAGLLGGSMLLGAALIKGVFMKRLQWTVLFSLLIHAVICLTLKSVIVESSLMAMDAAKGDVPLREISLPDYGGAESQDSREQEWDQPTDVELPEAEQQQRRESEIELQAEPEEFEPRRQVEQARTPDRRQTERQPDQRDEPEIEKQTQTPIAENPEQIQTPEIRTPETRQPEIHALDASRSESQLNELQPQQMEVQRSESPAVNATSIARRSDFTPKDVLRVEVERQQRESVEARSANAMAESMQVAEADSSPAFSAESRRLNQQRQTQSDLPTRDSMSNESPAATSQMNVSHSSMSRASDSRMTSSSAASPTSGGSASLQRSRTASGGSTTAASASASNVNVAQASGTAAPNIAANAASGTVARGQSSVPTGHMAGGSGARSSQLSRTGVSALRSGTIGRRQGQGTSPAMGDALAANSSGGLSRGRNSSAAPGRYSEAVGTNAGNVAVSQASEGGGTSQQFLANGPSGNSSFGGRSSGSELPSSSRFIGNGMTGGASDSGTGLTGRQSLAGSPRGRNGLNGRTEGSSAALGGRIGGGSGQGGSLGSIYGSGRRAAVAGLPEGTLKAEAAGQLVTAGPQSSGGQGASGGTGSVLSGPRTGTATRRRSGLPGTSRGPSSGAAVGQRGPALSSSGPSLLRSRRTGGGSAKPQMASGRELASMINRAVPGISPIPSERLNATFSMRTPEGRAEAVSKLGGSEASEAAVERGLEWLAKHQFAAGNWSIHQFNCKDHNCSAVGNYQADSAATGLALLAFLGAGNTHQTGEHRKVVARGLRWLTERQAANGDLFGAQTEFCWLYSHGMATIALCEAYGMTKDPALKRPAQQAVNFIVSSQHPKFGGWRYQPRFESDTSVSGWQLMALKSAEIAGLDFPEESYAGVGLWLDSVEQRDAPGRFSYHPAKKVTPTMSAEGLLMRQYLGAGRSDESLQSGASFLKQRLPRSDGRDVYYWYYGTQVMFHMQGEYWREWNAVLRDLLVETQDKAGHDRGSWDPVSPGKDAWGESGGRHYVTCLNILMLEVYYRHLPLYLELQP